MIKLLLSVEENLVNEYSRLLKQALINKNLDVFEEYLRIDQYHIHNNILHLL